MYFSAMCVRRFFFTKNCAFIYIDSGSNGKGMEWDPNDSCWNLRIPIPNLMSTLTSLFAFEFEPHDILKKRISSVELTLLEHKGKDMIKCFILIITVSNFFSYYIKIYLAMKCYVAIGKVLKHLVDKASG